METMLSTSQQQRAAAVILNNYGLLLLERCSYQLAMSTLTESIKLMKSSCDEGNAAPVDDLREIIRRASQRLARCMPSNLRRNVSFHVMSIGDGPFCIDPSVLKSKVVLLRIEPILDIDSTSSLDLEPAMLLYNYGTAYCCLGALTNNEDAADNWFCGAYKIFDMARMILENDPSLVTDELHLLYVLSLEILVVKSLVDLSSKMGLSLDHKGHMCRLDELVHARTDLDVFRMTFEIGTAPAA